MKTTKAKRSILRVIVVVIISVCMYSCEGEDGAVGPQGEQGEQGPAGQDGTDGTNGTDGADGTNGTDGTGGTDGTDGETGTANVIYSDWIPSEFPDNITSNTATFTIDAPEITQEIMNSGVVLVYAKVRGQNVVLILPQILFARILQEFNIQLGKLGIFISTLNGGDILNPVFESFRYVIIPGGVPAGRRNATAVDYTKMSYKEVATLFNIPE